MSKSVFTLPPAPNWFSSSLVSCSPTGWVVYGAKNSLVLLLNEAVEDSSSNQDWREMKGSLEEKVKDYPRVVIHTDAHNDRAKVTSVCWCPVEEGGPQGQNLVSGAEDGMVRLWKWNKDNTSLSMVGQHSVGKGRVTGASWSKADPGIVVTSDEGGTLAVWDLLTNTTRSLVYGRNTIFSLACHPDDPDLVGFGCKLGLVMIVSVSGTGRIVHRMRGHDEDVYSLAWSPSMNVRIGDEEYMEWMMASSSRDRTVRVWSSKEGRTVHSMRIPQERQKRQDNHSWITLSWPRDGVIFSSGSSGELISWDLTKPGKRGGSEFTIVHREHFKNLFSISCNENTVFTVGQDRNIVATSLLSSRVVFSLPCFAGFVYCLAVNPIDPSTLAIGAGDGQIRVWRMGGRDLFTLTSIHAKMNQSKIMSMAWHPQKEGLLAFGTDEGRVGWVEALGQGRMPTFSSYQHKGIVYCVTWGQEVDGEDQQVMLYSCGDGKVVKHCTRAGKGLDIQGNIEKANTVSNKVSGKSQVLWVEREEMKLLILGCDDGTIEIYKIPSLVLLATIKSQSKLIQSLSMHPYYMEDGGSSKYSTFLASASNEFPIHVFDLSNILSTPETSPVVLVSPTITLSGHLQRVIEVAWSLHTQARLVSVSYDFSGQVWDVEAGAPLHNFSGHTGRVMCCSWHPTLPGLVLTGGEDGVLHCWDPSQQDRTLPKERKKERKGKTHSEVKEAVEEAQPKSNGTAQMSFEELLAQHRASQVRVKEHTNGEENSVANSKEVTDNKTKEKKIRSSNKKHFFQVSIAAEQKNRDKTAEECIAVHQSYQNRMNDAVRDAEGVIEDLEKMKIADTEETSTHLGFFHSRSAMYSLLDEEKKALCDDVDSQAVLGLWTGNLGHVVDTALQKGNMTERMLSHCAGVSMGLWRKAAQGLGRQMVREGDILRGSEYLLSSGSVIEAVTVLSKHGYHRAGVAIAKSRLGQDCDLVRELMSNWAKQSSADGNFGLAAKCWLSVGKKEEAAEMLAKLGDRASLRVAALLVGNTGGKGEVYSRQCLTDCLYSGDTDLALKLVGEQRDTIDWALVLCLVHKEVLRLVQNKEDTSEKRDTCVLMNVKAECEKWEYSWSESNYGAMTSYVQASTHPSPLTHFLLNISSLLAQSLFPHIQYQERVGLLARAFHLLHAWPQQHALLLLGLLPGGAQAPSVGRALLGKELDLQCNWAELRSIQCSEGLTMLDTLEKNKQKGLGEDEAELLADCFMLEDVIRCQKLHAEITEGDREVKNFKGDISENSMDKNEEPDTSSTCLDLTPSLSGTQTLSLTGGEWKSEGVSDNVPLPDEGGEELPPPPPPSRSFHQRFLAGHSSTTLAVKELQKLKWTLDKISRPNSPPFPDLSLACKRFLLILVERGMGGKEDMGEEDRVSKLGIRQRVARWAFYHGKRDMQEFFITYC